MSKKRKKGRAGPQARSSLERVQYSFGDLILVNVVAWALFLVVVFLVHKSYPGHGAHVWPFFSFIGIGFTIGSVLDYILSVDRGRLGN